MADILTQEEIDGLLSVEDRDAPNHYKNPKAKEASAKSNLHREYMKLYQAQADLIELGESIEITTSYNKNKNSTQKNPKNDN
jgi:hypothetical protein